MIGKHKQAVILGFHEQEMKLWLHITNKVQRVSCIKTAGSNGGEKNGYQWNNNRLSPNRICKQ